jgi:hypothetical protein
MGLDAPGLVPEFQENPDWKESDGLQQKFDQKATQETGRPVINGCSPYGSNLRDMITSLDDVSSKLKDINVAELFDKDLTTALLTA